AGDGRGDRVRGTAGAGGDGGGHPDDDPAVRADARGRGARDRLPGRGIDAGVRGGRGVRRGHGPARADSAQACPRPGLDLRLMRPKVAFGALDAPNATLGALDATNATLGRFAATGGSSLEGAVAAVRRGK